MAAAALAPGGGAELKFLGVLHAGRSGRGTFKLTADQLGWKCTDPGAGESQVAYAGRDVRAAEWQHACGKDHGLLKLRMGGEGGVGRFAGFRLEDAARLRAHLKAYFGVGLTDQKVATAGTSWGDWDLDEDGAELRLLAVDGRGVAVEVPVAELSQVTTTKQDLNLEMREQDGLPPDDEVLQELRLFFPGVPGTSALTAEQVRDTLLQRTSLSSRGAALLRVTDVGVVAPRGKHDLEFFPQMVKLHGKTRTYALKYSGITKLFLLQLPRDEAAAVRSPQMALVIGLTAPLVGGAQTQPFLVLILDEKKKVAVDLSAERRKSLHLGEELQMDEPTLVTRLFKGLSAKFVVAASSEFRELLRPGSASDEPSCLRCTHKTAKGYLFPLKKSLIFITKPVVYLQYSQVASVFLIVNLARGRTFDFVIEVAGSDSRLEFSQMDRAVMSPLFEFLQKAGVIVSNADDVRRELSAAPSSGRAHRAAAASAPQAGAVMTRRQAAKAASAPVTRPVATGAPARGAAKVQGGGDEYDEDDDSDFDEAGGGESNEEDDSASVEEESAPRAKRPRRSAR